MLILTTLLSSVVIGLATHLSFVVLGKAALLGILAILKTLLIRGQLGVGGVLIRNAVARRLWSSCAPIPEVGLR